MTGLPAAAAAARMLLSRPARLGRVRLGVVDGPSGSGKTTFAALWAAAVASRSGGTVVPAGAEPPTKHLGSTVTVLSTDVLATWTDPFAWWDRVEWGVLQPLAADRPGAVRVNRWVGGYARPGQILRIAVPHVLILEGVSSARWAVVERASAAVWVEIPDRAERLARAVARDGEASRPYLEAWQDAEEQHFDADGTRRRADMTVRLA